MGWSCAALAGDTMERWTNFCRESSGQSNVWKDKSKWYMFEVSSREHPDGAITGAIQRFTAGQDPTGPGGATACHAGSFRIEPDGTVTRAPKALLLAGLKVVPDATAAAE